MTLAHLLKLWRGDRSEAKAGAELGVAQTTFGAWFDGRSTPPLTKVPVLSEKLGLPADELRAIIEADRARRLAQRSAGSAASPSGEQDAEPAPSSTEEG